MGHPGCLRPDGLERNSQEFWSSENPHPDLTQNARLGWGSHRDLIAQMGHLYVYQWVDVVVLSG
jgi:hypothetical protein